MTDSPILIAKGLSKTFDHDGGHISVLRDVDLTVESGARIAVIGQSGAGKSTLLHVLGTLDTPTEGTVHYEGKDVFQLSSREIAQFRNRFIGFMFQFHHLLNEFSAVENVMIPRLISQIPRKQAAEDAKACLESVGLAHRFTHRPGELSGGEQQRVALARALVNRPRMLLADEPTGNLDGGTSDEIHALFDEINETYGTAMLIVTHNRSLAARMPIQLEMRDGRLGPAGEWSA